MQQDNGKKIPVRDRLIEALETQIEKQEQIIATGNLPKKRRGNKERSLQTCFRHLSCTQTSRL